MLGAAVAPVAEADGVDMVAVVALVISGLALVISAILAFIKVWETFFVRPKLSLESDWIGGGPNQVFALRFHLINGGRAPTTILEITFGDELTQPERGYTTSQSVLARLPMRIEPLDAAKPAFVIDVKPPGNPAHGDFDVALRAGRITHCFVRTADNVWHTFPLGRGGEPFRLGLPPGKRPLDRASHTGSGDSDARRGT